MYTMPGKPFTRTLNDTARTTESAAKFGIKKCRCQLHNHTKSWLFQLNPQKCWKWCNTDQRLDDEVKSLHLHSTLTEGVHTNHLNQPCRNPRVIRLYSYSVFRCTKLNGSGFLCKCTSLCCYYGTYFLISCTHESLWNFSLSQSTATANTSPYCVTFPGSWVEFISVICIYS